ncbi:hypothetical protein BDQ17DRAFT_1335514 [Cyathus striatus]|nr:hypothetical protein BDQ17DRAFT_1335514 [Cyathus striatus]
MTFNQPFDIDQHLKNVHEEQRITNPDKSTANFVNLHLKLSGDCPTAEPFKNYFQMRTLPLSTKAAQDAMAELYTTHSINHPAVYDINENEIQPADYQRYLINATVEVHFQLSHSPIPNMTCDGVPYHHCSATL